MTRKKNDQMEEEEFFHADSGLISLQDRLGDCPRDADLMNFLEFWKGKKSWKSWSCCLLGVFLVRCADAEMISLLDDQAVPQLFSRVR